MHDIYTDSPKPHLTPEQAYEAFTPDQAGLADALKDGVFASSREEALDHFNHARRQYTGNTTVRTYVPPEDQIPVINYVADKIDEEGKAGFKDHEVSPEEAMGLYRKAYDRYKRLARYPGHDLSYPEQLARVYFPMRDLYRRGATIAQNLGDEDTVKEWGQDWLDYSNGPEEKMREYDEEYGERSSLYDRFLLDKEDDEVWEEVIHRAQHEDDRGEAPRFELQDISTEELSELAGLLRGQTKDEQYATLMEEASNGRSWNRVLTGIGDAPLVATLKRFLAAVVTKEEIDAGKKNRLPHAVIMGGRDISAIEQMVFSRDRPAKGGLIPANPIAKNVTVIEPSEALRTADEKVLDKEPHVKLVDGIPTDMPFENQSQELIVGTHNTEAMDDRTLSDFYLELARVLKHGGVYIESNGARNVDGNSFDRWKSLLAQMIADTVEDRGAIPDRLDPDKEAAMLKGLGLTEQTFDFQGRTIRTLVKKGAVKKIGWHMLEGMSGSDRLFHIEVGGEPDVPFWSQKRQTNRNTIVW